MWRMRMRESICQRYWKNAVSIPVPHLLVLDALERIVYPMDMEVYAGMRQPALRRIEMRDADDWPVLACAMVLGWPIWTEDADFFGTGVATWTTDRIALYLGDA